MVPYVALHSMSSQRSPRLRVSNAFRTVAASDLCPISWKLGKMRKWPVDGAIASSPLSSRLGLITFSVSFVLFGDRNLLEGCRRPGRLLKFRLPKRPHQRRPDANAKWRRPKEAKEDEKKRLHVAFAIIDRHRLVSQSSDRLNERS